jgi:curved DNA-binding protein CbpA
MGQNISVPQNHVQIYQKINAIQNQATKLQMIETVLSDPLIADSAKRAGVYAQLLSMAASIRHGRAQQGSQSLQPPRQNPPSRFVSEPRAIPPPISSQLMIHSQNKPQEDMYAHVAKSKRAEKALNYFTTCLRVLNIQEEVALTEEALTKAYKRAVLKAHPDKPGGSKEAFDGVTRAYAYLGEILSLTRGRKVEKGGGPSYDDVHQRRSADSQHFTHAEPVKLNPKNLNLQAFNQMFEQTRVPDPDEDGYGDWLKEEGGAMKGSKKFSDDFNREVFNRMFENETQQTRSSQNNTQLSLFNPQELTLAPMSGVELGRDRPPDFTAAANASLKYTDLRQAYTKENTIQDKIQGIHVEQRNFDSYRSQRERAPDQYNSQELAALQSFEAQKEYQEQQRRLRAAQEQVSANDYFERMKRLVITDTSGGSGGKQNLLH